LAQKTRVRFAVRWELYYQDRRIAGVCFMAMGPFGPLLRFLHGGTVLAGDATDSHLLDRFAHEHDPTAFDLLAQRHGPMVLAVCRRVLRNGHDAEDAFQATLLVLACKAGSIGKREALASWLYGVAYRTALKARAGSLRRREHELQASRPLGQWDDCPTEAGELRAVLDEELGRLPHHYRTAVVLHHLEGRSVEEAARQLGWKEGRFRGALFRGRQLLQDRLRRRGLAVGALAVAATAEAAPTALHAATVDAAALAVAGEPWRSAVPASVTNLVEGVLRDMMLFKLKIVSAFLVLGALLTGAAATRFLTPAPAAEEPKPAPAPPNAPAAEPIKPKAPVQVPSRRDSVVNELLVKEGDSVKEGQVLARLDNRLAAAEFKIKQAKVAASKADMEAAEKTRDEAYQRWQTQVALLRIKATSAEEVRAAELTYSRYKLEAVGKAEAVKLAELELEQAQILLDLYTIRSPITGTVESILKQRGEAVKEYETVFGIRAAEKLEKP
jgi:RNA polymerase sigma-70 factor (ECF subfamily)